HRDDPQGARARALDRDDVRVPDGRDARIEAAGAHQLCRSRWEHHLRRARSSEARRDDARGCMTPQRIGVVGAGNIGIGVVTDLLLHGMSAVVVDLSREQLEQAQATILNNIRCVPLFSKSLPRLAKESAMERMQLTTDLRQLAECDFVVENVTEDWAIKKALYQQLDSIVPAGVRFG